MGSLCVSARLRAVLCETEEGRLWPLASLAGQGKHSEEGQRACPQFSTGDDELGMIFQVEERKSNTKQQIYILSNG